MIHRWRCDLPGRNEARTGLRMMLVLSYRVIDPAKSVIAVSDAGHAVYQLALTSLRNIIGQHDLDEVLRGATARPNFEPSLKSTRSPYSAPAGKSICVS